MSPTTYLLDTNTFSYIADGRSAAARAAMMQILGNARVAVSSISEGEILYGIARRPQSFRLHAQTNELFAMVSVLPWDSDAAQAYATLRLKMSASGKSLTVIDTLIAAHAISTNAILVTRDGAFSQIDSIRAVLNWATDI